MARFVLGGSGEGKEEGKTRFVPRDFYNVR